jgi:alkylated DNA repair protein (DNA oxidative demethylase)
MACNGRCPSLRPVEPSRLLIDVERPRVRDRPLGVTILDGFRHLPGYLTPSQQAELANQLSALMAAAPPYKPTMPRTGKPFSVRMTNCGPLGWVSDKVGGYRYQATHPVTGRPWPAMPNMLLAVWTGVAGYPAPPEACLVNLYEPGAKMGSHRDEDEEDGAAPVVSISLGDDATFHVGGLQRAGPKRRMILKSGDVVVLGGPARMAYHGVDRIHPGTSSLLPGGGRLNLTLRRVTAPPD